MSHTISNNNNSKELSIITWNVWFDQLEQNHRYDNILSICKSKNPDIICFQEVTLSFMKKIIEFKMNDDYVISDPLDGNTIYPYGVLTLCKYKYNPIFKFIQLTTNMDRKLLITELYDNNSIYAIGNIHLESLNYHLLREKQLEDCYNSLHAYELSILCGDFNFCSYRNYVFSNDKILENNSLHSIMIDYIDIWLALHNPNTNSNNDYEKGYTYDTVINEMISSSNNKRIERMRYDRICYKANKKSITSQNESISTYTPISIELIGTNPIQLSNIVLPVVVVNNSTSISSPTSSLLQSQSELNIQTNTTNTINTINSSSSSFITPRKDKKSNTTIFPSDHFGLYCIFNKEL